MIFDIILVVLILALSSDLHRTKKALHAMGGPAPGMGAGGVLLVLIGVVVFVVIFFLMWGGPT